MGPMVSVRTRGVAGTREPPRESVRHTELRQMKGVSPAEAKGVKTWMAAGVEQEAGGGPGSGPVTVTSPDESTETADVEARRKTKTCTKRRRPRRAGERAVIIKRGDEKGSVCEEGREGMGRGVAWSHLGSNKAVVLSLILSLSLSTRRRRADSLTASSIL